MVGIGRLTWRAMAGAVMRCRAQRLDLLFGCRAEPGGTVLRAGRAIEQACLALGGVAIARFAHCLCGDALGGAMADQPLARCCTISIRVWRILLPKVKRDASGRPPTLASIVPAFRSARSWYALTRRSPGSSTPG